MDKSIDKICAYYSHGPHFLPMLDYLRAHFPGAAIVAFVPPNYPAAVLDERADSVVVVEKSTSLPQLLTLRRLIRAQQYQLLVVMFDSPRLRLLAAGSDVPHCYCYGPNRRYLPLERGLVRQLVRGLNRQVCGRIRYAYIWCVVHYRPVK